MANVFSKINSIPGKILLRGDGLSKTNSIFLEATTDKTLKVGNESTEYLTISEGTISGLKTPTDLSDSSVAVNKAYVDNINNTLTSELSSKDNYLYWTLRNGSDTIGLNVTSQKLVDITTDAYLSASMLLKGGNISFSLAHKTYSANNVGPTSGATLDYGGSFVVPYIKVENGHISSDGEVTFTLPSKKSIDLVLNTGEAASSVTISPTVTNSTLKNLISSISVDDHTLNLTTTDVSLPELTISSATGTATTIGSTRKFSAITAVEKTAHHTIKATKTEFTLPAETSLSLSEGTPTSTDLEFGGSITSLSGISVSGHTITKNVTTYTLPTLTPAENSFSAQTPSHGGSFKVINGITVNNTNGEIGYSTSTVTLPSESGISVSETLDTNSGDLEHGGTFTVLIPGSTASGHSLSLQKKTFTLPTVESVTIPSLSLGSASATSTLTDLKTGSASFKAITGISVSDHKITPTTTTFTIPRVVESEITVETPTPNSVAISSDGKFSAINGISGALHTISPDIGNFTISAEVTNEDVLDVDGETILSQANETKTIDPLVGGTITDAYDISVKNLKFNKLYRTTTFSPLRIAGGSSTISNSASLSYGGKIKVISSISLSDTGELSVSTQDLTLPAATVNTDKYVQQSILESNNGTAVSKPILLAHDSAASTSGTYLNSDVTVDSTGLLTAVNLTATDTIKSKNAIILGDLIVGGSTISENKVNISTSDYVIELAKGRGSTGTPISQLAGFFVGNYDGNGSNGGIFYDATGSARVGKVLLNLAQNATEYEVEDYSTQPILTRKETSELTNNQVLVWDATNKRAYTRALVAGTDYQFEENENTITTVDGGSLISVSDGGSAGNHDYTVSHATVSTSKPNATTASNTSFTYVSDITTDGYGHATKVEKVTNTIAIPTIPDITFETANNTSGGKLNHSGSFTVLTGYLASGHTLTPQTTTYTLPAESSINIVNPSSLTATSKHGGTFNIISGATSSGHTISLNTKSIQFPSLSVNSVAGTASALSESNSINVVTGVSVNSADADILDVTTSTISLSAPDVGISTASTGTKTLTHAGTFTAITGLASDGHGVKPTVTTFTMPSESSISSNISLDSTSSITYDGSAAKSIDVLIPTITTSGHALNFKKSSISLNPISVALTETETTESTSKKLSFGTSVKTLYDLGIDSTTPTKINWNSRNIEMMSASEFYTGIKSNITSDFVDKSTAQTISAQKTFSSQIIASAGVKAATITSASTLGLTAKTTASINSTALTINSKADIVSGGYTTTVDSGTLTTSQVKSNKYNYVSTSTPTSSTAAVAYSVYNETTESIDFIFA